jgi:pSer/pThr/pTyr-binding forkhead associated (FHA) protein
MHAELVPLDGGTPVVLNQDITVVGRKTGVCDLIIDRDSISKLHCLVVKTDGLLFVRDLGSTNGTKVNGQRVVRGALLPGDELAFAGSKFRVVLGPGRKGAARVTLQDPTTESERAAG